MSYPVLFPGDATDFDTNGLGRLSEATSFLVNEVLNGGYEITMGYPKNGIHYNDVQESMFLYIKPNQTSEKQPFRIYKIEDAMDKVTIRGQHRSYDLSGYPVMPFTATGVIPSLSGLVANCMVASPYTVWSDVDNDEQTFTLTEPRSFRACLGGVEGSIIQRFKGELEFDNTIVKLHTHRGSDNGVTIRYGKNLEKFVNVRSTESAYNGVISYWKNQDSEVHGNVVYAPDATGFKTDRIFVLDASQDFQEQPTQEALDARSLEYIEANDIGVPYVDSVTVSFVPLWQTEEYKSVAALERVSLGDTVHVKYPKGYKNGEPTGYYDFNLKVIEYTYDALRERYTEIKLGNRQSSFASTIKQTVTDSTSEIVGEAVSMMDGAINHAMDVISGGTGGYIVIGRNADGQPNELYIMDSPDMGTAVNVLRINYMGIAFSQTGINGQFTTAWTIDSNFVADFITAGEINGNLVRAGSILASALEVAVQTLVDNLKLNFSFLSDGLHVATKDGNVIVGAYQTILSDLGMRVIETSSNNAVLIAEEDTVTATNLTANQYLRVKSDNVASRFQQFYSTPHGSYMYGVFWEIV